MKEILYVSPGEIKRVCPIYGCAKTRNIIIENQGLRREGMLLYGEWDIKESFLKNTWAYTDFMNFRLGKPCKYNWAGLYYNISANGYVQNRNERYIEVALGRRGFILLDGRHRLICCVDLKIKKIPVQLIFKHPDCRS